jgi:hypothetical protein
MTFVYALTHYPGMVPTVFVGVIMVFWLLVIAGLFDFESVGPDWLGDADIDVSHDGDVGAPTVLAALGLDRLPFSVVVSAIGVWWWLLTMLATPLLGWLPLPTWLSGSVVLFAAFAAAVPLAALSLRPLKPIFIVHEAAQQASAIGKVCRIITTSVEENFGQAEVEIEAGNRIRVQVGATVPNRLQKDSRALIIEHDKLRNRYQVAEYDGP